MSIDESHVISWDISPFEKFTLCSFYIASPGGLLEPHSLNRTNLPEGLEMSKGLILSGRGPIWLYGYLVHLSHPFAWVGIYDPRLRGAVVIERHVKNTPELGEIIKLPESLEVP
jgi:CRISPR-associated protein Csx3